MSLRNALGFGQSSAELRRLLVESPLRGPVYPVGSLRRGVSGRALSPLTSLGGARREAAYERAPPRLAAGGAREGHEPLLRALEPVALELVEAAGVGHG